MRQLLHHTDEDGRHHQHVGQVHGEGGLKEERLEEGGGEGDHEEEEGGEVGGQHLTCDLSLQEYPHPYSFPLGFSVFVVKVPSVHKEQGHISILHH